MNEVIQALLFLLPAGLANSAPPIANKIPLLNRWKTPIDFGKKIDDQYILGKNKTWRGLFFGTLIGGFSATLIYDHLEIISLNEVWQQFLAGCLLGFFALLGDAIESFFKRRKGIASGNPWIGFDQLDYVAGALLASLFIVRFNLYTYLWIIGVFFGMHFVVSYIGYLLGFKDKPV